MTTIRVYSNGIVLDQKRKLSGRNAYLAKQGTLVYVPDRRCDTWFLDIDQVMIKGKS